MTELVLRTALAATLHLSDRALRRRLAGLAAEGVVIRPIGRGRAMLFTAEDVKTIMEALRCPYTCASAAKSGTRAAPYVSGARRSLSPNSAQALVAELTQKPPRPTKRLESVRTSLRALPGGRGAPA